MCRCLSGVYLIIFLLDVPNYDSAQLFCSLFELPAECIYQSTENTIFDAVTS